MRITRVGMWVMAVVLVGGLSAVVAHADGIDPQGKFQAPPISGTPGVGADFSLAAFGSTSPGCTFTNGPDGLPADGTEDCILKNQSSFNWTYVTLTTSQDTPCGPSIPFTTDLFENVSCSNDAKTGDATFVFSGVNYSAPQAAFLSDVANLIPAGCSPATNPACDLTDIQTGLIENQAFSGNCQPDNANGIFPGVPVGCDFEFNFSPGADGGNWALGTTFDVAAPEPSTLGILAIGLGALMFAGWRRKALIG